ncbi:beta-1,4-galactosyltransferase 6-like [Artemia franciscana]|uniref:Beta-1,4-N-acetylgalactosaminyltransferase n=1 Tax=Artemia franciscana TaxID=6661 RepID=A0AA88HX79_ARTSF|nr:hypothetical protein QYM36_010411 [Artemia franciscana]
MTNTDMSLLKKIFLGLLGTTACVYLTFLFINSDRYSKVFKRRLTTLSEVSLSTIEELQTCLNTTLSLEGLRIPNLTLYPRDLANVSKEFVTVQNGQWQPQTCVPKERLAVIVPYRNRTEQLPIFLYHMHRFLQKQKRNYQIFIIEQQDILSFNRAALFNVGFKESQRYDNFTCFIFHDVDLLPENDNLFYSCEPGTVRHFAELISNMKYERIYTECAGGVTAFHIQDFQTIDGFSNVYWGWGGEDDDLYRRVKQKGLKFEHQPDELARYTALKHAHSNENAMRFKLLNDWKRRIKHDGLSSLVYNVSETETHKLYLKIGVNLNQLKNHVHIKWKI